MGGHGGLNILPQKRWNVYNFDNREKVKRDEEKAAREEAIERQQARQREAELRLEKLREAAGAKRRDPSELRITEGEGAEQPLLGDEREDEAEALVEAERPKHFNLFEIASDPGQGSAKPKDGKEWINDLKVGSRGGLDKQDIRELKKMEKMVRAPEDEGSEFGSGLVGKSGKKPWYSTKRFMVERTSDIGGGSRRSRSTSPGMVSSTDGVLDLVTVHFSCLHWVASFTPLGLLSTRCVLTLLMWPHCLLVISYSMFCRSEPH
jgi:nucleotide-binding universal stress UspA family protein